MVCDNIENKTRAARVNIMASEKVDLSISRKSRYLEQILQFIAEFVQTAFIIFPILKPQKIEKVHFHFHNL